MSVGRGDSGTVVGLLLHGADDDLLDRVVGAVARADGLGELRHVEPAPTAAAVDLACRRLAETCDAVVGLHVLPWPGWEHLHDRARTALAEPADVDPTDADPTDADPTAAGPDDGGPDYWAVQAWHGLPALAVVLADHVARAVAGPDDRVLLTAPDAAVVALSPEQRPFLREAAEALDDALAGRAARPTVAVDRSPSSGAVTPAAASTVTTLVEAHGAQRVVRCSLAPGDGPDPDVTAAAVAVGATVVDVAPTPQEHVALLLAAVEVLLPQVVAP